MNGTWKATLPLQRQFDLRPAPAVHPADRRRRRRGRRIPQPARPAERPAQSITNKSIRINCVRCAARSSGGRRTAARRDYREFMRDNSHRLMPYAAYRTLRDEFGTADFSRWGDYARRQKTVSSTAAATAAKSHFTVSCSTTCTRSCPRPALRPQPPGRRPQGRPSRSASAGRAPTHGFIRGFSTWIRRPERRPTPFPHRARTGASRPMTGSTWRRTAMRGGRPAWRRWPNISTSHRPISRLLPHLGDSCHAVHGLLGYFNPALPYSADELRAWASIRPGTLHRSRARRPMLGELFMSWPTKCARPA